MKFRTISNEFYRDRAYYNARIVTGEIINEGIVYFTLSKSDNFISR